MALPAEVLKSTRKIFVPFFCTPTYSAWTAEKPGRADRRVLWLHDAGPRYPPISTQTMPEDTVGTDTPPAMSFLLLVCGERGNDWNILPVCFYKQKAGALQISVRSPASGAEMRKCSSICAAVGVLFNGRTVMPKTYRQRRWINR